MVNDISKDIPDIIDKKKKGEPTSNSSETLKNPDALPLHLHSMPKLKSRFNLDFVVIIFGILIIIGVVYLIYIYL
ncbi:MAG: hypothetical protein MUF50_02260 [Planctomycetes bacterium]|jgi:hypothetical protein|nr:hypothetical protein [Planctomycetota bacterium]